MKTLIFIIGIILPYFSLVIFIAGIIIRIWSWVRIPVPLKIPTTPAPETTHGVILRIASEVLVFRSLFRADKILWLGGIAFHVALIFILLRHLRYFIYPVPSMIIDLGTSGIVAGLVIPAAILYLFSRRLVMERVRYISTLPDYLVLLLILLIALTGIILKYFSRVDLVSVKAFILSLITFRPVLPPVHLWFLIHFSLVMILLIYFPWSKLIHAGGIFFSSTINQKNDSRKRRFINPWDYPVD